MMRDRTGQDKTRQDRTQRVCGVSQRQAAAEKDEWKALIVKTIEQRTETEETMKSNQLQDKEQLYLRRVNRALHTTNSALWEANNGTL